jgi:hypothetical protein
MNSQIPESHRRTTMLPGVALLGLLVGLLPAGSAFAHEISFNRNSIRTDEYVRLTIALEGEFARTQHIELPLENLTLVAGPSTSTEFRWSSGETTRRKIFTYQLRPNGEGRAAAGPVVVTARNGDQLTLRRVSIDVTPTETASTGLEGELYAGRMPVIVAEASASEVYAGQQIEVQWVLYGDNIRGIQVLELPSFDGFWVEQLEPGDRAELVRVGERLVQRQVLRHVLLYPIEPGFREIAPLAASIRLYRRDPFGDVGGWNPFGGSVSEVMRRSDSISVHVKPSPAGTLPTGVYQLECGEPNVPVSGPVSVDVTLRGEGNLRSVGDPAFVTEPPGSVRIENLGTRMRRQSGRVVMERSWRYLLFPEQSGAMSIPPISFRFFDPAEERRRSSRCGGWIVTAAQVELPVTPQRERQAESGAPGAPSPRFDRGHLLPALAVAAALFLLVPLLLRRRRDPAGAKLVALADRPAELRSAVEAWLVERGHPPRRLRDAPGPVGEAWRSLTSLLDLVEREPWELEGALDDLRRRTRELVDEVGGESS